jgi:hypothetical protein
MTAPETPVKHCGDMEDNEQNYRDFLAYLLSRTKSRGNTRYYNKFAAKCKDQATLIFPNGAKMAAKSDIKTGGWLVGLLALFGLS